jgi:hypothetical protein
MLQRFYQVQVARAVRLRNTLKLSLNKNGAVNPIFGEFVLPPSYRKVPPEGFAIVKIRPDDGGFEVKT